MIRLSTALLLTIALSACSTIDRGTRDHVRVDSVPQGAEAVLFYVDESREGKRAGKVTVRRCPATPCAFEVDRKQHGVVRIQHPGYEDFDYFVGPSKLQGGGGYNAAATGSIIGTGALGGIYYAAVTQFGAALTNLFTLGAANATGTSTASGILGGTGVGLGLVAGSLMIDSATAANTNIYPNPTVIGLAESGETVPDDPFVKAYVDLVKSYQSAAEVCKLPRKEQVPLSCVQARRVYSDKEKALMQKKKDRDKDIHEAMKAEAERLEAAQEAMEAEASE